MHGHNRRYVWLPYLALAALGGWLCIQDLTILTNARLCAEEATIFYKKAFLGTPLFSRQWLVGGYLDPLPVIAAKGSALWAPMEWAPWVFLLVALLGHFLPGWWILRNRSEVFDSPVSRSAAILMVGMAGPIDLLWLTSFMGKFYLGLGPVLVLMEGHRARATLGRSLLMLASPLFAIQSLFIAPVVVVAMIRSRNRDMKRLCGLFLVGALMAGGLAVLGPDGAANQGGYSMTSRLGAVSASNTAKVLATSLVAPWTIRALTPQALEQVAVSITKLNSTNDLQGKILQVSCAVIVILIMVGLIVFAGRRPYTYLLLASAVCMVFGSQVVTIGQSQWALPGRYLIAPSVLLGIAAASGLSARSEDERSLRPYRRWVAIVLVVGLLLIGCIHALSAAASHSPRQPWRQQVAAFRADPEHVFHVGPLDWHFKLSDGSPLIQVLRGDGQGVRHLTVTTPAVGREIVIAIEGCEPGEAGTLIIRADEAEPTERPDGALILPTSTPSMGELRSPVTMDETGAWSREISGGPDSSFLGRTYSLQYMSSEGSHVSEIVIVRVGR